jgi:flagellar biogenesis protein FliO
MPLRLVAQLSLGGKRYVSVVEVGGMQFLVGGGAENVTVIIPIATETAAHKTDKRDADRELQP